MSTSPLQELFMREWAATFMATTDRLSRRLNGAVPDELANAVVEIVRDELRGLYHGSLVIFDGGTSLADAGLIHVADENGLQFDRNLHELCFDYWPTVA